MAVPTFTVPDITFAANNLPVMLNVPVTEHPVDITVMTLELLLRMYVLHEDASIISAN